MDAHIQACRETVVLELGRHTRELQVIERARRQNDPARLRAATALGIVEWKAGACADGCQSRGSHGLVGIGLRQRKSIPCQREFEERVRSFASFASANP